MIKTDPDASKNYLRIQNKNTLALYHQDNICNSHELPSQSGHSGKCII